MRRYLISTLLLLLVGLGVLYAQPEPREIGLVEARELALANNPEYLSSLAVSFTFGLLFASVLILFNIPMIYSMVDSFFGKFGFTRFKEHKKFNEVMECKTQD